MKFQQQIVFALALPTLLASLALAPAVSEAQQHWTQFRGPEARGIGSDPRLPTRWSAQDNVLWKADLPGRGWSSPVVWGDRVFLTTVVREGEYEAAKKGLYFGGDRPKPPESVHHWWVYCLDLGSGELLWKRQVHQGPPETSIHIKSSYASETPIVDGRRLYVYFGNVGVFCLDLAGKPLWEKRLQPHATRNGWGTAASPVLHDGRLYLVNDNEEQSYLLALDAATGKELWRTERDEKSNWSTPYIWENSGRTEIVTPGTGRVRSYDLDGRLLWSLQGMSSITIATPYEHNGLLYISSGYVGDRKRRPIYAIRPGAAGDISLKEEESSNEWIVWAQKMAAPYNPSTLIYDDMLVVLYDFGFIAGFDPATGKEVQEKRRIPKGRAFTASPWAYNGHVFCINEDGVTFVLQPAKSGLEIVHQNTLAEDDMIMATPAIAGGRLLIRSDKRLYCIGKP